MNCPICKNVSLMMSTRQEIEIDYCPQCRGVWLDRGELDKIIERSATHTPVARTETQFSHQQPPQHQYSNHQYHGQDSYKKKRREGFLSDLFDF